MSMARSSSRVRMPSSTSDSSTSRSALCACDLRDCSRFFSLTISERTRSRSALRGVWEWATDSVRKSRSVALIARRCGEKLPERRMKGFSVPVEDRRPRLSRYRTTGCMFGGTGEGACPPLENAGSSPLLRVPERILGRLLLRFLLRRSLAARGVAADLDLDDEALVVIRPFLGHDAVVGKRPAASLGQLLQCRLVVVEEQVVLVERGQVAVERALDEQACRVDAAVE